MILNLGSLETIGALPARIPPREFLPADERAWFSSQGADPNVAQDALDLHRLGYLQGVLNGSKPWTKYDRQFQAAVMLFQTDTKIKVDGLTGPQTRATIAAVFAGKIKPEAPPENPLDLPIGPPPPPPAPPPPLPIPEPQAPAPAPPFPTPDAPIPVSPAVYVEPTEPGGLAAIPARTLAIGAAGLALSVAAVYYAKRYRKRGR